MLAALPENGIPRKIAVFKRTRFLYNIRMMISPYRNACAVAAFLAAGALCAADYVDFNKNGKKDAFEDAARPVYIIIFFY